jgi:hypothetical protein
MNYFIPQQLISTSGQSVNATKYKHSTTQELTSLIQNPILRKLHPVYTI